MLVEQLRRVIEGLDGKELAQIAEVVIERLKEVTGSEHLIRGLTITKAGAKTIGASKKKFRGPPVWVATAKHVEEPASSMKNVKGLRFVNYQRLGHLYEDEPLLLGRKKDGETILWWVGKVSSGRVANLRLPDATPMEVEDMELLGPVGEYEERAAAIRAFKDAIDARA